MLSTGSDSLNLRQQACDRPPFDTFDRRPVQRLSVICEIAFRLLVGVGLLLRLLTLEEAREQRAERLGSLDASLSPLGGRIASETDLGEEILGHVVGFARIKPAQQAEDDAAGALADHVLDHPAVHTTRADAKSKSWQALVEIDLVDHAWR